MNTADAVASTWAERATKLSFRVDAFIGGELVPAISGKGFDRLSPQTPFGGFKQSVIGRDLSLHALDEFTAHKTAWISY